MENGNGKWIGDQIGQATGNDLGRLRAEASVPVTDTVSNADARAKFARDEDIEKAVKERVSPPGTLGLPSLLDRRRLEWAITDGAFKLAMTFDRVLVYQIPEDENKNGRAGKDSRILLPDEVKARFRNSCPRGIIIAAGASALDSLRSNGIDLGHVIYFIQSQPWRLQFDYIGGKPVSAFPMNAGDIIGSEDLRKALQSGACRIDSKKNEHGVVEHFYVDQEGHAWNPVLPWSPADSI